MEEQNKVIMSLEEYTKLVIENNNLKNTLRGIRNQVISKICDKISEARIHAMTRDQLIALIDQKDVSKICDAVGTYTYSLEYIDTFGVFSVDEVKVMFVEEVKKIANDHLQYLLDHAQKDSSDAD